MVSFKSLLLLGCATLGATAAPLEANSHSALAPLNLAVPRSEGLETRNPPNMRVLYSQATGKIVFGLGASFPQAITDVFSEFPGGPATALAQEFVHWLQTQNVVMYNMINPQRTGTLIGGIYGVVPQFSGDIGIGIELGPQARVWTLRAAQAIAEWASQSGGLVRAVQDATVDQLNLRAMGAAGNAARDNTAKRLVAKQCPANLPDIRKYATGTAPANNDWEHNFKYVEPCA